MTVSLRPEAYRDLTAALDYVAERDPDAAERLRQAVFEVFDALDEGVLEGPCFTMPSGIEVRRFFVHPFWLYYLRRSETLVVLRVRHHARSPL